MPNVPGPGPAKRIFLVFEGGGAKGIVHVGALRALEAHNIQIDGVAGTSAGAIIASLVAAGYRSDELVAADGTSPVLQAMGLQHATDFFGKAWGKLAAMRWAMSHVWFTVLLGAALCVGLALLVRWFFDLGWAATILALLGIVVVLVAIVMAILVHGLVRLDTLVEKLERALQTKLGLNGPVYFRHLDAVGRPLRIVATDLIARQLKLFSSTETPDVRVAEAVAASAALPIAFVHRVIAQRKYIDGGIVSNLPAWTFDEERALDPDTVTVAVSIADDARPNPDADLGFFGLLMAVIRAAVFGRRTLETRAAPRLVSLKLGTEVAVIDFDMGSERAASAVADAERAARAGINERLFNLPGRFEEACQAIRDVIDARVDAASAGRAWRTRVQVAMRDPGAASSWRIQYGTGLETLDSDDQLLLPEDCSIVGHAALAGVALLQANPLHPEVALSGPANRYRNAMVRRDLAWGLAIPIYRAGAGNDDHPLAMLAIDSDLDVEHFRFDETVVKTLSAAADTLVRPVVESCIELQ